MFNVFLFIEFLFVLGYLVIFVFTITRKGGYNFGHKGNTISKENKEKQQQNVENTSRTYS